VPVSLNKTENGDPPGDQDFEEIDIAEEELIDRYVRDELSFDERQLLEKGLRSSPELVNRLHFARLFADAADRAAEAEASSFREGPQPSRKSWWPFGLTRLSHPAFNLAFAASALIILIGAAGLLAAWINLRRQTQQVADQRAALARQKLELDKSAAEQRLATEQTTAALQEKQQQIEADQRRLDELIQAQNQKANAPSAGIATLFLTPSLRSSDAGKELSPPPGTSKIKLQLAVKSIDYHRFLVEIKNSQDKVIFRPKAAAPRSGKLVSVTIPRQVLPSGTYSLQVSGISSDATPELLGNYSFRITSNGPSQR
jgi:hypothetical protein